MTKKMWLLPLIIIGLLFAQGTYYNGIDPNSPAFITTLGAKLIQRTNNSYSGFSTFARQYEKRPDGKVYCVYINQDETNTFNREHTWCNSWMPTNPDGSGSFEYADYHNLFPTNVNANSVRGNWPFGNVASGVTFDQGGSKLGKDASNKTVFEPRDAHKGDAARTLLYMAVCYNGYLNTNWSIGNISAGQDVAVLLNWHQQDPPDAWEKAINEAVFNQQGNRNPFVDHPEWTSYINFNNLTYIPQVTITEPTNYPSNFVAGTVTDNTIQVNWTDAVAGTQAPTGYVVQLKTTDTFTVPVDGFPLANDLDLTDGTMSVNVDYSAADTYTFSNLSTGTYYYVRIYSYNTASGTINYKTDGTVPALTQQTTGISNPLSFSALPISATQINLYWQKNNAGNNTVLAYNTTNTFGTPQNGTAYTVGQEIAGGGTVLANGGSTLFSHTDLTAATTYYYKIWSATETNSYSGGISKSAATSGGGGGGNIVLEEDFSLCTAGTITTPDGTDISTSALDSKTHTPGWTGLKVYQAGGAVKIGSSSAAGFLATPTINLSTNGGNATLKFDLVIYTSVPNPDVSVVQIMHAPDGTTFTQVGEDITAAATVENKVVNITGGTASSRIKFIQKNAAKGRFILDNIKVEQGVSINENDNHKMSNLISNYPNPFNPSTSIVFNIQNDQQVKLNVFNVAGKQIYSLSKKCSAGQNSIKWNADNLPAGIYLYSVQADGTIMNGKMSLIK